MHWRKIAMSNQGRNVSPQFQLTTSNGGQMKLSRISAGGIFFSVAVVGTGMTSTVQAQKADMTFFVTSAGKGNGADLGGLEGADAHCLALAKAAGSKYANWRAYLSTTLPGGEAGGDARDRIGKGPWRNAKGVVVAKSVS